MSTGPHAGARVLHAGASLRDASLAVVLLHGRGGSAEDILQLAETFNLPHAAFLAPQAAGHTWYPLSFLAPRESNEPYLSSALALVKATVQSVQGGCVDLQRIVIAGFSQGACLATEFVFRNPSRYGGLIAFTGGLIGPPGVIETSMSGSNSLNGMPAFLGSGDPDPHVPWSRVEDSASILRSMGASVKTQRYPGRPHTVTADEIARARTLLQSAENAASAGK